MHGSSTAQTRSIRATRRTSARLSVRLSSRRSHFLTCLCPAPCLRATHRQAQRGKTGDLPIPDPVLV
jgi:hypothetical protein